MTRKCTETAPAFSNLHTVKYVMTNYCRICWGVSFEGTISGIFPLEYLKMDNASVSCGREVIYLCGSHCTLHRQDYPRRLQSFKSWAIMSWIGRQESQWQEPFNQSILSAFFFFFHCLVYVESPHVKSHALSLKEIILVILVFFMGPDAVSMVILVECHCHNDRMHGD